MALVRFNLQSRSALVVVNRATLIGRHRQVFVTIAEMLVQSTGKAISVLPAVPLHWSGGILTGVRVRGGGRIEH